MDQFEFSRQDTGRPTTVLVIAVSPVRSNLLIFLEDCQFHSDDDIGLLKDSTKHFAALKLTIVAFGTFLAISSLEDYSGKHQTNLLVCGWMDRAGDGLSSLVWFFVVYSLEERVC